jgi:zinc transporter ZupT
MLRLFFETAAITLVIGGFAFLPRYSAWAHNNSRVLLLVGTGALASLLIFDLIPDLVDIGGVTAIYGVIGVWLIYSLIHLFHTDHQVDHPDGHSAHASHTSLKTFLLSMIFHSASSGMLLYLAHSYSRQASLSVFFALLLHKAYEALSVSLLLSREEKHHHGSKVWLVLYGLSFPIGVALSLALEKVFDLPLQEGGLRTVAVLTASFAVGSLLSCLIHDFVLPSIEQIKNDFRALFWVLLGGATSVLFSVGFFASSLH